MVGCMPLSLAKVVEKEVASSRAPSFEEGSNFSAFKRLLLPGSSSSEGLPFRRRLFPNVIAAAAAAASVSPSDAIPEMLA